MVKIKLNPMKYATCLSCGRDAPNLLRAFIIGHEDSIKQEITLCTECLGELVKQEILYQPKGEE